MLFKQSCWSAFPVQAITSKPSLANSETAMDPTPPVDPVTWTGPSSGAVFFENEINLSVKGIIESPILGPKGNKEFLIYGQK